MLIPNFCICSFAAFVGLINLAKPDLIAFAPCSAVTPPSLIAVIITARSLISPPRPLTTGATRGMAAAMSCIVKIVSFSVTLRKSMVDAKSSLETPNAVCKAIVAPKASSYSIRPRVANLIVCSVAAVRLSPCAPVAATLAANSIVLDKLFPYFVYSIPSSFTASRFLSISAVVVLRSP